MQYRYNHSREKHLTLERAKFMLRTILIDDEKLAIERLRRLLSPYKDSIEIVYETSDSTDAVEKIDLLKPDVVFLDIQMPVLSGFDVLAKITYKPIVIFITAYDKYALKAFETNSVDYLLKPVEPKRLKKAILKLKNFSSKTRTDYEAELKEFLKQFNKPGKEKLSIKIGSKIMFVDVNDICFFKASDKYVEAVTAERKYILTKTLSEIEEEFGNSDLIRIHRSYIVNLKYVESIEKTESGAQFIKIKNVPATTIPVSRYLKHKLIE